MGKKRAKKIAIDRKDFKEMRRNHVTIDEAMSMQGQTGQWATASEWNGIGVLTESDEENEENQVEMAPYEPYETEQIDTMQTLPAGWNAMKRRMDSLSISTRS